MYAIDQQFDLLIDLAKQLHSHRTGVCGVCSNSVKKPACSVPERYGRRSNLKRFNCQRRIAHFPRAANHILVAQKFKQARLIHCAPLPDRLSQHFWFWQSDSVVRHDQGEGKVRRKQVGLGRVCCAARFIDLKVRARQ